MTVNAAAPPRPVRRARVIALHCSGAGASQWSHLAEMLGDSYEVAAPEHYGCESTGPWTGAHAFTLADEAERAIALIDEIEGKVHLAGHSYGGGVALAVALARPGRVASMALYEPAAFHLLRDMGGRGAEAYAEIVEVAERICLGVTTGDYREAAAAFVDYWNGPGAWEAMRPSLQTALIRWTPKGPLDFHALLEAATPPEAYTALTCPVLLLRGEHGPIPTRIIVEALAALIPSARPTVVAGAGHMGPLTHATGVSALIAHHIAASEAGLPRLPWRSRTLTDILPAASPAGGGVS
jgi:pimeloyl-ACP methyl ester carboxylesterase